MVRGSRANRRPASVGDRLRPEGDTRVGAVRSGAASGPSGTDELPPFGHRRGACRHRPWPHGGHPTIQRGQAALDRTAAERDGGRHDPHRRRHRHGVCRAGDTGTELGSAERPVERRPDGDRRHRLGLRPRRAGDVRAGRCEPTGPDPHDPPGTGSATVGDAPSARPTA